MAAWIPAALSAVGSIGQSILAGRQSRRNVRDTHAQQKELQQYAFNQNLEMWNRMNEYNLPSAQMERFKQAGLNPHLIYGQGTPGNAQTMPEYQAPTLDFHDRKTPVDISSAIGEYMDTRAKKSHIDYLKKRTDAENVRAYLMQSQITGVEHANDIARLDAHIANAMLADHESLAESELMQRMARGRIAKAEAYIREKEAEWVKQGINPRDATWLRMLVEFMKDLGLSSTNVTRAVNRFLPDRTEDY